MLASEFSGENTMITIQTWGSLPLWKKVTSILICLVTIVGVEYVLFKDWSSAPLFEHIAAFGINALILFFVVKIAFFG